MILKQRTTETIGQRDHFGRGVTEVGVDASSTLLVLIVRLHALA